MPFYNATKPNINFGGLYELAGRVNPTSVLEIGLGYWGLSTRVWLDCGIPTTTIDKGDWKGTAVELSADPNFTFIQGLSDDILPTLTETYDLIYIDGDHRYEQVVKDINNAKNLLNSGGIIAVASCVDATGMAGLDDNGNPIEITFGTIQACDDCFTGWTEVHQDINFFAKTRCYGN